MLQQVRCIADLETQSPLGISCVLRVGGECYFCADREVCFRWPGLYFASTVGLTPLRTRFPRWASFKYTSPHEMNPDRQEAKKAVGGIDDQKISGVANTTWYMTALQTVPCSTTRLSSIRAIHRRRNFPARNILEVVRWRHSIRYSLFLVHHGETEGFCLVHVSSVQRRTPAACRFLSSPENAACPRYLVQQQSSGTRVPSPERKKKQKQEKSATPPRRSDKKILPTLHESTARQGSNHQAGNIGFFFPRRIHIVCVYRATGLAILAII